jgi:Alpha-kinase family
MALAQQIATRYAQKFNQQIQKSTYFVKEKLPRINVLPCFVVRLKDDACSGGFRYLSAEKYLDGKLHKINGNNGYTDKSNDLPNIIAQAFSHFTFSLSKTGLGSDEETGLSCSRITNECRQLVCDIQGVDYTYTDPSVCTMPMHNATDMNHTRLGGSDVGVKGIKAFFETHTCNYVCRLLSLQPENLISFECSHS